MSRTSISLKPATNFSYEDRRRNV